MELATLMQKIERFGGKSAYFWMNVENQDGDLSVQAIYSQDQNLIATLADVAETDWAKSSEQENVWYIHFY